MVCSLGFTDRSNSPRPLIIQGIAREVFPDQAHPLIPYVSDCSRGSRILSPIQHHYVKISDLYV